MASSSFKDIEYSENKKVTVDSSKFENTATKLSIKQVRLEDFKLIEKNN